MITRNNSTALFYLFPSFPSSFFSPADATPEANVQRPWKAPSKVKDSSAALRCATSSFWTATGANPDFRRKRFQGSVDKK